MLAPNPKNWLNISMKTIRFKDNYESLLETAELLSEKGLRNSIKKADKEIANGKVYTANEVFGEK